MWSSFWEGAIGPAERKTRKLSQEGEPPMGGSWGDGEGSGDVLLSSLGLIFVGGMVYLGCARLSGILSADFQEPTASQSYRETQTFNT
jgi:hypothetical protein